MKRLIIAAILVFGLVGVANAWPAHKWCGMYARTMAASDPGSNYNQACSWLHYGSPTYAHEGAFVVWCSRGHHHVGKITGPCEGSQCVVTSGNDGHAVRTRMRSVAGAVFRE